MGGENELVLGQREGAPVIQLKLYVQEFFLADDRLKVRVAAPRVEQVQEVNLAG